MKKKKKSRFFEILLVAWAATACSLSMGGKFSPYDTSGPDEESTVGDSHVDTREDDQPADAMDSMADPELPIDAEEESPPDAIEDGRACVPSSTWCNPDGSISTCNEAGTGSTIDPCRFGCADLPSAHCRDFFPSNTPDASLLCVAGATAFSPAPPVGYLLFNTDDGSIENYRADGTWLGTTRAAGPGMISGTNFAVLPQPGGAPNLAVFSVESFNLPAGIEIRATGTNALALFSCGDVVIEGTLNAGSLLIRSDPYIYILPGPGGGDTDQGTGAGEAGGSGATGMSGGGGGGSFGGVGGNGGTTIGGGSGTVYGNDILVPLLGGSGGGHGADNGDPLRRGWGGPSGGALQISTPGFLTVAPGGIVEASGWGGFGGIPGAAGGGGGSGGGILIEAHTITVSAGGFIAANGGGGGSGGDYYSSSTGEDGERGHTGPDAAQGGTAPAAGACAGGDGNSAAQIDGESITCTGGNGGGGGGGAGRIRLNALFLAVDPNAVSPFLTASPTTTTTGDLDLR
jgi:hypothetical protein